MAKNRSLYLAVVTGCVVFYVAYREWFSWFALMWVLALPWLSLIVSLPAMLTASVRPRIPISIEVGTPAELLPGVRCPFPAPPVQGRWELNNKLTGARYILRTGKKIPTDYCGMISVEPRRMWVYDYMGLFRLPLRKKQGAGMLVLPVPIPVEDPPALRKRPVNLWRPKAGGGFSENHDLRLYRPGDSLRLIHWKLASKTGKLIYREPIEALRDKAVLSVSLSGTPEDLNEKLGKMLWLSRYLLEKDMHHELRCATGRGEYGCTVSDEETLKAALWNLLQVPAARTAVLPDASDAYWHHHIGGGNYEA